MNIKLLDLLKENSQSTYKFGCAMLYFNFPEINKIQDAINPEDIYDEKDGDRTFGLEDEPHTTFLYGLHKNVTDDDVKKVINNFTYEPCIIHNPSLFEQEKYDVLKFDVKGKNLHETNKALRQYPYTSDFPDYHPHLTIGYIKPGLGKKYVNMFKNTDNVYELTPLYAVYSKPDGSKTKFKIKLQK